MKDTSREVREKMQQLLQKKSPEERLRMGCDMLDFSRKLVTQSILQENPKTSEAGLRRALFLRFYGHEFGSRKVEEILKHLTRS